MALTLNNIIGFETGGLEEASSIDGTANIVTDVVRTGNYALRMNYDSTGANRYSFYESDSGAGSGNKHVIGFAVKPDDVTPVVDTIFIQAISSTGSVIWQIYLKTNGDLYVNYNAPPHSTITGPVFTQDQWAYIEILWEEAASGTFDLHVNGVSKLSDNGKDLQAADPFDRYRFRWYGPSGSGYCHYDDIYCMSGASSVSDFLGPHTEVLGAFQNTVEDATDQGETLDQGTWAITGDTPGVDDGTPAGYTSSDAKSGHTNCDEGDRDGPAALITGTSKGAKWIHRLRRGNGGGTIHYLQYGKVGDVGNLSVDLTTSFENYFVVGISRMPILNTDNFAHGFRKLAGGRAIYCAEMWAFLLHVAPDPSTLDLSDMDFPDQNYYLGPFST